MCHVRSLTPRADLLLATDNVLPGFRLYDKTTLFGRSMIKTFTIHNCFPIFTASEAPEKYGETITY